jgi:glycerate 2-kinase
VRLVIAPDKFKGSLSARQVADAMAAGIRRRRSDSRLDVRPMADGGEGTTAALHAAVGGEIETHVVAGPMGGTISAPLLRCEDGRVAVEAAAAAGLWLFHGRPFDPLDVSTRGVGELMQRAIDGENISPIIVGIGGTATTDGGTGAAAAFGWRFMDARGRELRPCGRRLNDIARIERPADAHGAAVVGAADVTNPLLGERGAARVFGPQKGATNDEIAVLEDGLANLAERIRADIGRDVAGVAASGAGGGLGAGLAAFFDAKLRPGFDVVAEATGLRDALRGATAVITGEGCLDHQSLAGKTAIGVARCAREVGVPCAVIAGRVELDDDALRAGGISTSVSLVDRVGRRRAIDDAPAAIADAAADLAGTLDTPLERDGRAY